MKKVTTKFTYEAESIPVSAHSSINRWRKRRKYIVGVHLFDGAVVVWTHTHTAEHNRAVQSLARIIDRAILKTESLA
jgi:hypothetical protein